jgi:hypothetical protein
MLEEQHVLKEGLYSYSHLLRYLVGVARLQLPLVLCVVICRSTVVTLPSSLSILALIA